MTIGTPTNQGNVNQDLTALSVEWRDLASATLQKQAYYNKLGVTGLQALGFSPADAQSVLDAINHMATCAQVYKGIATQPATFNFEDSLTGLWGGS